MKLSTEQIRAAVQWWSDRLANETEYDNGATDPENLLARHLSLSLAAQRVPTTDQIAVFRVELERRLLDADDVTALLVDYHPATQLREAAEVAGIDEVRFPVKTYMRFLDGGVQVACGYRARFADVLGNVQATTFTCCGRRHGQPHSEHCDTKGGVS